MNLEERIKEEFEIIGYLNQFNEQGIKLLEVEKRINENSGNIEVRNQDGSTTVFVNYERIKNINGEYITQKISYANDSGVNYEVIERFVYLLFQKKAQKHKGLSTKKFINNELEYLDGLSERIKKEYKYSIRPLIALLETFKADHRIYKHPNLLRIYLYFIFNINDKDQDTTIGSSGKRVITVPKGYILMSFRRLSSELELSKNQIGRGLKKLKEFDLIDKERNKSYTLIKPKKYI